MSQSADTNQHPSPQPADKEVSTAAGQKSRHHGRVRTLDVRLYRYSDALSEALIYFMVVFSPWAFGTTQPWSMWTMNVAGYCLGSLLGLKLYLRHYKGYRTARWDRRHSHSRSWAVWNTRVLACLTFATLAYCLVSALNARATVTADETVFNYHESYFRWLPHSMESRSTWSALWKFLALACAFWSIRDWLLEKTSQEQYVRDSDRPARRYAEPLPGRVRRLLWVMILNGGLLAVEGIIQRLEGSGYLLFLVQPRINSMAEAQFGPYAYRANASSWFNLVWPVAFGFWWTLHFFGGLKGGKHHLVLFCAGLMAACPVIATSRAGTVITVGMLVIGSCFLIVSSFWFDRGSGEGNGRRYLSLALVLAFCCGAVALGYWLGWERLAPRMAEMSQGYVDREKMYERALPMARDYPLFGTGPGTFELVFQLYRFSTSVMWPAQLHNDWLETRITFGWVGSVMIFLMFGLVLARWYLPGGIRGGRRFVGLTWLAMAGCLVHARWDFPFQVYSILFLFLVLCAILSTLTRRS